MDYVPGDILRYTLFTSISSKKTNKNHWLLDREETFFLGLEFENEKTSVNEAIQAEYDRQKEDLSKFDDMAFEGEIDGLRVNILDTEERTLAQALQRSTRRITAQGHAAVLD